MRQRGSILQGPAIGPATKWLLIGILAATVIFTVTQRQLGFGIKELIFSVEGVLALELWRLVTFPFVETDFFSLLLSLVILYFFGRFFESEWGSRYYTRFFVISSIGAAVLAVPLSFLIDLVAPFQEIGMAAGPDAAINAMLVAMAVTLPDSNVLFGFVLPMRARTMIYVVLGLQLVAGLMNGAAAVSVSIGGMIMGYVLVTGIWRPDRLRTRIRLWQLRRRRGRGGLHVVPPRDKTLH